MDFFKNPEIKRGILVHMVITVLAIIAFFFLAIDYLFVLILSLIFLAVNLIITYKRYEKISSLSSDIDKLLHGGETIDFSSYAEGELAILQDEIYKMTIRLREQREELQKDKLYLADAIADISHQLRTPLTSMNLVTSLLSKRELKFEERRELVNELSTLLGRMDWLVDSLLKLSKLDAGTAVLQQKKVYLKDLIKKSSDPLAIALDIRGIQLKVEVEGEASFIGDLAWSAEAIGNLLKNAMEHSSAGDEIFVEGIENALYTEIVVKDQGKGIDPEDLPHLFERFYKGRNSGEQSIGIGLALARTIISSQNGTIKVENNRDRGAKFTIRFYKGAV